MWQDDLVGVNESLSASVIKFKVNMSFQADTALMPQLLACMRHLAKEHAALLFFPARLTAAFLKCLKILRFRQQQMPCFTLNLLTT